MRQKNIQVVIGSKNPVKTQAVKNAFYAMYPEGVIDFISINAPSLVSIQPNGIRETKKGAMNRLSYCKAVQQDADFWITLEGGVIITKREVLEIGYIVASCKNIKRIAWAEIARFPLPVKSSHFVREGMELGPANDLAFGLTNSKQDGGMPAIITKRSEDNFSPLDRLAVYTQPAILAFAQLKNHKLYS